MEKEIDQIEVIKENDINSNNQLNTFQDIIINGELYNFDEIDRKSVV